MTSTIISLCFEVCVWHYCHLTIKIPILPQFVTHYIDSMPICLVDLCMM